MVNGQCLMVNVQSFYCCQIRGPRGLRASKFPRALGKFFSLTGAHLFLLHIDNAKVQKICEPVKKMSKKQPFLRGIFRAKNAEK